MIKIPIVNKCAYSSQPAGVIMIRHDVIAILADAVHDKIEWLALLTGIRSDDGLSITVTGLEVPPQYRTSASCDLVNEEPLESRVVGVVHSHHEMFCAFSTTDTAKLNPRFPVSIVIAQLKANSDAIAKLFGFQAYAEGHATLPCGRLGTIPFRLYPQPLPKGWPQRAQCGFKRLPRYTNPGCDHVNEEVRGFKVKVTSECGLVSTQPRTAMFGRDGKGFMKEVKKQTQVPPSPPLMVTDQRALYQAYGDDFLTHWSDLCD